MAQPFSDTPKVGVNLNGTLTAAEIAGQTGPGKSHRLGAEVFGTDGKLYVYVQANAAISAGTAVVAVDPATFLATATGGSYKSPATAVASGDRFWASKASV
jgi:hypothetical protein